MSLFSAFATTLRQQIWPAGEAKTLRTAHTSQIKEAMTDLQKNIPELQVHNTTLYPRCDRLWEDAKTVIEDVPNGLLRRVFTIVNGEWRDKVFYDSSNFIEVERWAKKLVEEADTPPNVGFLELENGFRYEESSVDSDVGRARKGAWAIYRNNLFIVPWLQSNEVLVLEWDGVKTTWADSDVVDDLLWTNDVQEAIQFYVLYKHNLLFVPGSEGRSLARDYKVLYEERRADLMVTFRDRTKQQELQPIPESTEWITQEMVDDDDEAAETSLPCYP